MKFMRIIGTLIATVLIACVGSASAQSLYVPDEVTVALDRVSIGDLVQGEGSDLIHGVAGDFICRAPEPGESRLIKGEFLKSRLSHAGLSNVGLPQKVKIVRSADRVTTGQIRREVTKAIRSLRAAKGKDLNINFKGGLSDVVIPTGPTVVEVDLKPDEKLRGRMVVPVTVYVSGQKIATKHIDVQIDTLSHVWTVKYPVPKGKVLTRDHIEKKQIALTKTRGRPFSSINEIVGKRTTRALSEGTILVGGTVETTPVMKKGDIVSILVETEDISIRGFGIVLKEAMVGAVVPVKNMDSGKKIFARVINGNSVRVSF